MKKNLLDNPHAGKILNEELIKPTGTDILILSEKTNIPINILIEVIENTHDITEHIDEKLCKFFALSKGYFLRLQQSYYDIEQKRNNKKALDKTEEL